MTELDMDILKKSVTYRDHDYANTRGGVLYLSAMAAYGGDAIMIPPEPPRRGSPQRDVIFSLLPDVEDMWSAGSSKAISEISAQGWTIKDSNDSTRRTERIQELLLMANGGEGWVPFIESLLFDYLHADNGGAVEIVRASAHPKSRILAIYALDTLRVTRTGNPRVPYIYTDLEGHMHEMQPHQIYMFVDKKTTRATLHGMGRCAASRAYHTVYKLAATARLYAEKITGTGANAVTFVDGISPQQMEDAFTTFDAEKRRRGITTYKGHVILASMKGVSSVNTVELAGVAEGFDVEKERNNAYIIYANALGVPVQDIAPLQGQGLGSGTQTRVLDEAAQGQGMASWRRQWLHFCNQLFPESTTFVFDVNDTRDQKAKAEVQKLRAETRTAMIADGTISAEQARQLAVDSEDLPPEFIAEDQTAGGQLSDDQKPLDRAGLIPLPPPPTPAPMPVAEKAARYPEILERLIARLTEQIDDETTALELGQITPDGWQSKLKTLIERYTGAAWKAGQGGAALEQADVAAIKGLVQAQAEYLDKFTIEIKDGARWERGWNSRAEMYAESIKAPYWKGRTKMLPLPAMPAEGTQCLTRCKCMWDVVAVDAEAGDYDAYWRRGAGDSCQTCVERAAQWAPLQIRGGELL